MLHEAHYEEMYTNVYYALPTLIQTTRKCKSTVSNYSEYFRFKPKAWNKFEKVWHNNIHSWKWGETNGVYAVETTTAKKNKQDILEKITYMNQKDVNKLKH